jgi:hypothetical protein
VADLKVDGEFLSTLDSDLFTLIDEFQGALDLQHDTGHVWGQLNANLSMNDFADNWTVSRNKMVDDMKSFKKALEQIIQSWDDADQKLAGSLQQKN